MPLRSGDQDPQEGSRGQSRTKSRDRSGTIEASAAVLIEDSFSGVKECPIRALRLGIYGPCSCSANDSGCLATIDDGSTGTLADKLLGSLLQSELNFSKRYLAVMHFEFVEDGHFTDP